MDARLQRLARLVVATAMVPPDALHAIVPAARWCWACGGNPAADDPWWRIRAHLFRDTHDGRPCQQPCPDAFTTGLCEEHFWRMAALAAIPPP